MNTNTDRSGKLLAVLPLSLACAFLVFTVPASAVIVATGSADIVGPASPDVLSPVAPIMDELGDVGFGFPPGEGIGHLAAMTALIACVPTNGAAANALITITNFTPFSFASLHYVASPGTTFSNVDGTINGATAFRIDTLGLNTPLVAATDVGADGIFSPGETWSFIVDDYSSAFAIPPDAFFTPGLVGAPDGPPSSASIVADIVPEPGRFGLFALGALALAGRRVRPRP